MRSAASDPLDGLAQLWPPSVTMPPFRQASDGVS